MIRCLTTDGIITEFVGSQSDRLWVYSHIIVGPDNDMWFTTLEAGKIGKLYLLTATGTTVNTAVGEDLRTVVASFHDDEPRMVAQNYTAQIDWGDGSSGSTGEIFKASEGQWIATGGHTYTAAGTYKLTVTITDTHPGGMATTTTSTIVVTDPTPPPSSRSH